MKEKKEERQIKGCPACGMMSFPFFEKAKKSDDTEPQKPNLNSNVSDELQDSHGEALKNKF